MPSVLPYAHHGTRDTGHGHGTAGDGPGTHSGTSAVRFAVQSHSARFNTHPTDAIPGELELELELELTSNI